MESLGLSGLDRQDGVLILGFSFTIATIYFLIAQYIDSTKGKAWLVMLMSSIVLSIFGTYYVALTSASHKWSDIPFIYGEDQVSRAVMLFFLSSNIMDLVLGVQLYPKYLDPFSTIAHHIFYIAFILFLLANHFSRGFMLCFFMEIPTCILSIGTVWPQCRADLLFGVTFLITRLLYNAFLAYQLYSLGNDPVIWKVCTCVLGLHLYWFSKWIKSYGKKKLPASEKKGQEKIVEHNIEMEGK